MKILRDLFLTLVCLLPMSVAAQTVNPVKWSHSVTEKGDGLYTVEFKAQMEDGWHIYVTDPAFTLNPTTFEFEAGDGTTKVGELRLLSKPHLVKDEYGLTTSGQEGYYEKEAIFEHDFKAEGKGGEIKVTIGYQACNKGTCLSPTTDEISVSLGEGDTATKESTTDWGALLSLILEAIIWGFAALLTPCVFPMVPMTVSFFMKNSGSVAKGRINAALYGLFIIALYTLPIALLIIITRVAGGDAVTANIFN